MTQVTKTIPALLLMAVSGHAQTLVQWGYTAGYVTNDVMLVSGMSAPLNNTERQPTNTLYSGGRFFGTYQGADDTAGQVAQAANIRNNLNGGNDALMIQMRDNTAPYGPVVSMHAQYHWRQADFMNGYSSNAVRYLDSLAVTARLNQYGTGTGRFMVQNNGLWFLSATSFALTNSAAGYATYSLTGLKGEGSWAAYAATNALDPGTLSFNAMTLTNVQAVGFYATISRSGVTTNSDTIQLFVEGFTATSTNFPPLKGTLVMVH